MQPYKKPQKAFRENASSIIVNSSSWNSVDLTQGRKVYLTPCLFVDTSTPFSNKTQRLVGFVQLALRTVTQAHYVQLLV